MITARFSTSILALALVAACTKPPGDESDADGDGVAAAIDCDDADPGVHGPRTWFDDGDGDGFGATEGPTACEDQPGMAVEPGDCDDADAAIHPSAAERCNGADDDCDGAADEELATETFWADDDGDGFGDPRGATEACGATDGLARNDADCDDGEASIHPGAEETCDGTDQDCDAMADEGAGDLWYEDRDGDGYGDPLSDETACAAPDGYVVSNDDCDDADGAVHPGAAEVCDGLDQDCDVEVDEDAVDPSTFWLDNDRDGYGDPASPTAACDAPSGYVTNDEDCDDADRSRSPNTSWYPDADGDGYGVTADRIKQCEEPAGYSLTGKDCDDAEADVHPGAAEVCNEIDDDCDDEIDVGAIDAGKYYADTDGDGYGDGSVSMEACAATDGWITDSSDCDDSTDAVNPDAAEICDDLDNQCDGRVDEEDPELTDATTWYADTDGDAYGDAKVTSLACSAPDGYLAAGGDCDDTASAVHPGASELCDLVDNDCDALTDASDPDYAGLTTYYADADGDGWGDPDSTEAACGAPSGYVAAADDCDDRDAGINPDAAEVCGDSVDDDCDGETGCGTFEGDMDLGDADVAITGDTSGDTIGYSIANAGDLDADGLDDLLVGDYYVSRFSGKVWLISGADVASSTISTIASVTFTGALSDSAGDVVAGVGEMTGDSTPDWALTADSTDTVYVLSGAETGSISSKYAATSITDTKIDFGAAIAGNMDLNSDGSDDLVVGAPSASDSAGRYSNVGAAFVFYGPLPSGAINASKYADAVLEGESDSEYAGFSLSGGQDLDADGDPDLVVGSQYGVKSRGSVWIVTDPGTGTTSLSGAAAELTGDTIGDYVGYTSMSTGDLDGDGYGDVAAGAYGDDDGATDAGAVYVQYGPFKADVTLPTAGDLKITGTGKSDQVGSALAFAGDTDGDGNADLLFGSQSAGGTGQAWLFLGDGSTGSLTTADAVATFTGAASGDQAAYSLATGDLDGDGARDLLFSAPSADEGGSAAGTVYLFYGI